MFMTGVLPDLYCDQLQADTAGQPFRQCGCCQAHPYRSERHTSKSRPRGHDIAFHVNYINTTVTSSSHSKLKRHTSHME